MSTLDDLKQLADRLHASRQTWDLVAISNALLPYRHLPIEQVTAAALRCANDQANRTPASLKWMDLAPRGSVEREVSRNRHEPTCFICGRHQSDCYALNRFEIEHGIADPHEFETYEDAERNATGRQLAGGAA